MQASARRLATAALEHATTFEQKLRAILDVFLDTVAQRGFSVGTLMQSNLLEGAVEERRKAREAQIVNFIADLIRAEYPMPRRAATTTAAILLAGSQGLAAVWTTQGWPRKEIADTFVAAAMGAIERVAREARAGAVSRSRGGHKAQATMSRSKSRTRKRAATTNRR